MIVENCVHIAKSFCHWIKKNSHEILFSTRFSTTFSTRFSTRFENIKNQYISTYLGNYWPQNLFYTNTLHSSFIQKKMCALHRRCFQKYPLFTPFLLVFTVDGVSYILNKYQPLKNLAKHQYFYTGDFILLLHFK